MDNLVQGQVCAECNNGWMSALEANAKPLIAPLVLDTFTGTLSESNLVLLSRWTLKTALVLNTASNYRRFIPVEHFEYLYKRGLPPSEVGIRIGHYVGPKPFYWIQSQHWIVKAHGVALSDIENMRRNSYKISIQLGKFLCGVHHLHKPWPVVEQMPGAKHIWPRTGRRIRWPPRSAFEEFAEFHMSPKVILSK